MKIKLLALIILLAISSGAFAAEPYGYPFTDPLVATILGTPEQYRVSLPARIPVKELSLTAYEDRSIPELFWYQDTLRFSLAYQKQAAPLIFVIAGTGVDYNGPTMQLLQKAFFIAGFHVVCLSSPTCPNFIITASSTMVPGDLAADSADLYRVMQRVWDKMKSKIRVSSFYLTGYSLGGAQAAFIARLDEDKKLFNFKKVLLINPPLSLYSSANTLDAMLEQNIPGGLDNFNAFFDDMMRRFSAIYKSMGFIDFNEDFLYAVFQEYPLKKEELAAIIGLSFRFASGNMMFTSDVMTHSGFIVPRNRVLTISDSLTDYLKVCFRTSFNDYITQMFYPFFSSHNPGLTFQELISGSSLKSIEPYLRESIKIGLVTNADDFLYAPGELDYLRSVFAARAKIYPRGGHCGNMAYRENVTYMINFFKN